MRSGEAGRVRRPAVAGSFYPLDPTVLQEQLTGMLASAGPSRSARVRAVVTPHAGYVYSGSTAAQAFAAARDAAGPVDRLVVIGPAHYVAFSGIAVPSVEAFQTPLGAMQLDRGAIDDLLDLPQVVVNDEAHAPEHALEVELPFLHAVLGSVPLVPLVVGSGLCLTAWR